MLAFFSYQFYVRLLSGIALEMTAKSVNANCMNQRATSYCSYDL